MPETRPFTWQQIKKDYPEFFAWIETQDPTAVRGLVTIDSYNSWKAAYGQYLSQQQALLASMETPTQDPEATA